MSDSNSIKPLGLATSMVAGAALGSVIPAIAAKTKDVVAKNQKADAFVKSVVDKAATAKKSVKNVTKNVVEKTKIDKVVEATKDQVAKLADKVKDSNIFNKIKNSKIFNKIKDSKVTAVVKDAAIKLGAFLKKPVVIGALVGALIYTTYKMIKQHQEKKLFEEV